MLAPALCLRGIPASAQREAQASDDEVRAADTQPSIRLVPNCGMCHVAAMPRDFAAADRAITHSTEAAARLSAPSWPPIAQLPQAKPMVERGEFASDLAGLAAIVPPHVANLPKQMVSDYGVSRF